MTGTAARALGGSFAKMIDSWVGKDFEDGLGRLDKAIEWSLRG